MGRLHQEIGALGQTVTHQYDNAGNLDTSTDARGADAEYTYDALGRVTAIEYSDQTIQFTYDTGTNGRGRRVAMADASGSTQWSHDAHGRVTGKTQTTGSISRTMGYAYNSEGQLQTITTPSGQLIGYTYSNGRVSGITINGAVLLSNALYSPFGPTRGWQWGNGTYTVREYDSDGRVTTIDSAGVSTYTYYPDGTIQSRNDDSPSPGNGGDSSLVINVVNTSNRIGSTVATQSSLTRSYSYDAMGNTTSNGDTTFGYNDAGRMTSSIRSGATTIYTYNGLGQRVRKTSPSSANVFVYDEAGHLAGVYDGSGALVEELVWLDDVPVATLRTNTSGGIGFFYIHTDHLNAPTRLTRVEDNAIMWRWDHDPYGAGSPDEDADENGAFVFFNLRFPGQYRDIETGLNYNYFRDYDPATGRYLESDPIGLAGGINTYGYVKGNPISFIDPDGQQRVLPWIPPRSIPNPGAIPRPFPGTIDPVMPMVPPDVEGDTSGVTDEALKRELEQCPRDCRGLLRQLREHEEKLRQYRTNPDFYDNLGFLKFATPDMRKKIIDGRIRNLERQIENFRRQLNQCLMNNGGYLA